MLELPVAAAIIRFITVTNLHFFILAEVPDVRFSFFLRPKIDHHITCLDL